MYRKKELQFLVIVQCDQDDEAVSDRVIALTGCTIVAMDELASGVQYVVRSKLSPCEFWEAIYVLEETVEVYELIGHTDNCVIEWKKNSRK